MEHAPTAVTAVNWLWLIPALPALGALVNAAFGLRLQRKFGEKANHTIAIGAMLGATLVAWIAFAKLVGLGEHERFLRDFVWSMAKVGAMEANLSFALDPLSMTMTLVVTNIATLIHIYSTGYMHEEPAYWRFFMWLNLFVAAMLLLVMGDNFALMFFGWEGVGLCSYGLIAFWYTDLEKAKAGMKAFVVNRFGDFGFVIGVFLLFWSLAGSWSPISSTFAPDTELSGRIPGDAAVNEAKSDTGIKLGPTLDFRELKDQLSPENNEAGSEHDVGMVTHLTRQSIWGVPVIFLICLFLFIGAAGKSAQIPLYVWLPDAMAGPTPVSALIHAATMVTAGVYMVARLNFLFALSPMAMGVVATIGCLTALFAASIGLFQYDIKKVLAYSTVSQLGFMFIGVGTGAYWAGVFHLFTHAFFKACLFLGSGSVILGCHHEQDMRKMGGLAKYMPWTRWTYLASCVAIAGIPVMSGFYSKDEILAKAFASQHLALPFLGATPWLGQAIWGVGVVAAFGTAFYMFRSYFMTFTGEYRGGDAHADAQAHDAAPPLHVDDPHKTESAAAEVPHAHAAHGAPADAADAHAAHGAPALTSSHAAHDAHAGHGGTPHESPGQMIYVLAVLAFGAFAALFLGLPELWTGHAPLFEQWLAPSLPAAEHVPFTHLAPGLEWTLMGFSTLVALGGIALAYVLYYDAKSTVPATLLARFPGVHRVVFNKYYVDEFYAATVLRGTAFLREALYWFDQNIIDGAVNLVGFVTRFVADIDGAIDRVLVDGAVDAVGSAFLGAGRQVRRLQTGHIENYLYGALGGAVVLVIINYVFLK